MTSNRDKSRWTSWSLMDSLPPEEEGRFLRVGDEQGNSLLSGESSEAKQAELYIRAFAEKLEALENLWDRFRKSGNPMMLSSMHRHCLELAKSGSVLGHPEVSEQAVVAEQSIVWLMEQEVGASLPWEVITDSVDALRHALQQAQEREAQSEEELGEQSWVELTVDSESSSGQEIASASSSGLFSATELSEVSLDFGESSFLATVWIVEQNALQAHTLEQSLIQQGFQCEFFGSGEDLLRMAARWQPDLILLDSLESGSRGRMILEEIRDLEGYEDIPVVFLSSNADEVEIVKAYRHGASDYMTKPVNPSILSIKLRTMILHSQERRKRALQPGSLRKGVLLEHRYRVLRLLGQGGMGYVYLVEDLEAGEERALKILHTHPNDSDPSRERFQLEIQTLRDLSHPHLVSIYDSGVIGELHYYTMDYLPGGSLATKLDEIGMYSVSEALRLTEAVASALQCLHEHHILHRDLKPENILFSSEGKPILTDLGLAVSTQQATERLTKTGHLIGTINYMAPEQIIASPVSDHRIDVYALGMILYEMLAGLHPLEGTPYVEMIVAILRNELPSLSEYNDDVPEDVVAICQKAIHRDFTKRFATAAEMKETVQASLLSLSRIR